MRNKVLQLEALMAQELKDKLLAMPKSSKFKNKFVVLSVLGKQLIVRNFELPIFSAKEIKSTLRFEAVEILSLHPEEIEIDYQILSSAEGKCKGVFAAMPKSVLEDYFAEISKLGFIPLALTAKILTTINAALIRVPSSTKAFYILDFIGEKSAFLALFNEGRCELLRDISYDNITEANQEISNSLRYALGKSAAKHPKELYFSGEIEGRDALIATLENEFNIKGEVIDLKSAGTYAQDVEGYFKINLIKDYTTSLILRRKLHFSLNISLGIVSLFFIFAFIGLLRLDKQARGIRKEFNSSQKVVEYKNKINDLKEKLKFLKNEK